MVDLGCATGPNTFSVLTRVIDTIQHLRRNGNQDSQEFQVFLNDLPDNDFNGLFKLAESLKEEKGLVFGSRSRCFVYGVPGSFYTRLFPRNSLHFAFSSCSLHWLSQVPQGLVRQNKENIYISISSPPEVLDAYAEQYKRDLSTFLRLRGEEMVPGGRMVLTFMGRKVNDFSSQEHYKFYSMLAQTLLDMVTEGLLERDDLYSFNIPFYMPCQQEVRSIINQEGSGGKLVAENIRAIMEPMLVSHFAKLKNCDALFERYSWKIGEYLLKEKAECHMLAFSLNRGD
ncbi:S-adenosyl-L-methionine-dependent methyltransferase superfamily protein [Dorcoceras hygrometricum]|uniref:S-adenosyl-L-methionine-dependent methyltransferase superfamily protein n=1 Tax=Dorcoceras hygrometricum TaxID=472368 RepID=A0A2Z7AEN0_9LAMI|nr:S-adenosyl-L-methionine-dependent methyltransferase superfamily protein [Dorcoceras hygrometricum]